ncbi:hypothetical protein [Henriciella aquimarina]|uniref:hypothetical protein n=1 Tax=Henriciella aquimarina TaxID=545261 RepID=UPI000A016521|nr:hypothetical protein [Henriciella aquimarina]
MNKDETSSFSGLNRGQIGIAVLGVSLCAACGVAWLSTGPETATTLSLTPAQAPANSTAPKVASTGGSETVRTQIAGAEQTRFTLIVKFNGEPVLDEIGKTFRKDPEGAKARFQQWASGKPALAGLRLERASYSGELILVSAGSRSMDEAIRAIQAMDNVAYVEPDYSARPSEKG